MSLLALICVPARQPSLPVLQYLVPCKTSQKVTPIQALPVGVTDLTNAQGSCIIQTA